MAKTRTAYIFFLTLQITSEGNRLSLYLLERDGDKEGGRNGGNGRDSKERMKEEIRETE